VESCDCLVVLSPDNPEHQERLADLALRSGKPVYIDKPFTACRQGAEACFAKARQYGSPLMSCSALRFAPALVRTLDTEFRQGPPTFVSTRGPGRFSVYSIHQLEMLVSALGLGARRVMRQGGDQADVMQVGYDDERRGVITLVPASQFGIALGSAGQAVKVLDSLEGYYEGFIDELLRFFGTGHSLIAPLETLEIVSLVECGLRAHASPNVWFELPARNV